MFGGIRYLFGQISSLVERIRICSDKQVIYSSELGLRERERAKEREGERDVVFICKKPKSVVFFLNARSRQQCF